MCVCECVKNKPESQVYNNVIHTYAFKYIQLRESYDISSAMVSN